MVRGCINRLLLVLLTIAVVGCAPVLSPPQRHPQPAPPVETPKPQPPVRTIEPVEAAPPSAQKAVQQLLAEGWQLHGKDEFERANAVAERALRLDRNNAEVYLLLSSNYYAMWQLTLAEQIARQGLPLAAGNRVLKLRLHQLIDNILMAQ